MKQKKMLTLTLSQLKQLYQQELPELCQLAGQSINDKDFRNSLGSLFFANRRSSYRKSHRYIYRMQESGKYPGNQQYGKVRGKHGYDIA